VRALPFAVILIVTLLIRLPFAFHSVVDWDESTFILVGQSIVDGHLPYTHLWDVKPPLLFAVFATTIAIFGHTIEAIRLTGALLVAASAALTWLIASTLWSRRAAWLASGLCLTGSSFLGSGQATMSEHVMTPFLLAAVYLMITAPVTVRRAFLVGVLLAAASLVRLNIAYAVVAAGLLVFAFAPARTRFRAAMAFAGGGLTLVALACLPYALAGELTTLWKSAVVAALARTETGDLLSRLAGLFDRAFQAGGDGTGNGLFWLGLLLWPGAIAGLVIGWRSRRPGASPWAITQLGAFLGAIALSIVMSGGAFGHYLIQLVPLASLLAGILAAHPSVVIRRAVWAIAAVLTMLSLGPVVEAYRSLADRVSSGAALRQGAGYDIAAFLTTSNPDKRPVLLLTDHVAYWLTGSEPPNGFATHPSTLGRPNLLRIMGTSPRAELEKIFQLRPVFVVLDRDEEFLQDEERAWLADVLGRDYERAPDISGREIWRRR
jgi:4-amino-4-deoxy-L-arabinose transferase-like glycosyltransferase